MLGGEVRHMEFFRLKDTRVPHENDNEFEEIVEKILKIVDEIKPDSDHQATWKIMAEAVNRANKLTGKSQPLWGKMSSAQMLAHCCVSYDYVYDDTHKPPGGFMKFILKMFVKDKVTKENPYKK